MPEIVLFGSGSPIIVDVEETCRRLGWTIAAAVHNVDGPDYASVAVIAVADGMLRGRPVLLPLFSPANRMRARDHALALGATAFPAAIDPSAILPRNIAVAEGAYVNAGCTIGAASRIGRFAFVNRAAALGHHLDLGDFASVGPGVVIAGQVTVGRAAMIGAGAVVLPGVRIGEGAIIAAGAVIRHDVAAGATAAGRS